MMNNKATKSCVAYFQVSDNVSAASLDAAGVDATKPGWTILCVQTCYSGNEPPAVGYRLLERNGNGDHRPGPWVVTEPPQRYAATNDSEHDFVYIYECEYQPLENPEAWTTPKKLEQHPRP